MEHRKQNNHRNIGRMLAVYLGSAWVFIEAINFLIDKYNWHTWLLDVIILLVIFGLPASVIHEWFYKKITKKAILLQIVNALAAISVISYEYVNPESINPTQLRILRFTDSQKKIAESIRSIAILPFDNNTGDDNQEYLVVGMHEALISEMGQIGAVRIISKTSTLSYKNTQKTIQEIASELNVDALIEASVFKENENIRVQLRLINAFPEEQQLWSQSFDSDMIHIFDMYSRVTKNIANEIYLTLSPEQETRLNKTKKVNPEAYKAYLNGEFHANFLSRESLRIAMEYYEQALKIDPLYAAAYNGISGVWGKLRQMGFISPAEATPKIEEYILKAIEIDGGSAEAYYREALTKWLTHFDLEGAEKSFRRTLEINPNYAIAWAFYSHLMMNLNRHDEMREAMKRALEIDPHNLLIQTLAAVELLVELKYDSCILKLNQLQAIMPNNALIIGTLFSCYTYTNQHDLAIGELRNILQQKKADKEVIKVLDDEYSKVGFKKTMNLVAEVWEERSDTTFYRTGSLAFLYTLGGNTDKALYWIKKGYLNKNPSMPYIGGKPIYKRYYNEPQFIEIMTRMNLPFGKFEYSTSGSKY